MGWRSAAYEVAPSALLVVLPKCPVCLGAYLGLASGLGLELGAPRALWPLAWASFAVAFAVGARRALRRGAYAPVGLLGAGALLLVAGRLGGLDGPWLGLGAALAVVGTLSSLRPPRAARRDPTPAGARIERG